VAETLMLFLFLLIVVQKKMEVSGFMTQLDSSHVVRLGDLNYNGHEEEVWKKRGFQGGGGR
jgi:hypothetical protein